MRWASAFVLALPTALALGGCSALFADVEKVEDSPRNEGRAARGDENAETDASLPPGPSSLDGGGELDATPEAASVSCAPVNNCRAAMSLGSISGDEGQDTRNEQGFTSKWFAIEVREDRSTVAEVKMKATLVSPPGVNFDLFAYATGASQVQCTSVTKSSKNLTPSDEVILEFGGGPTLEKNQVALEVRQVSGDCSAAASWALTIRGNP
jgi:hypothetical protein